eukprot:3980801-Alexandrium_andersonii.AAC.1
MLRHGRNSHTQFDAGTCATSPLVGVGNGFGVNDVAHHVSLPLCTGGWASDRRGRGKGTLFRHGVRAR